MLSKGERNILSVGYGSNKSKVKAIILPAHLYIIFVFLYKIRCYSSNRLLQYICDMRCEIKSIRISKYCINE